MTAEASSMVAHAVSLLRGWEFDDLCADSYKLAEVAEVLGLTVVYELTPEGKARMDPREVSAT